MRIVRIIWAAPTSVLGLLVVVAGSWRVRLRVVDGVIEAHGPALAWLLTFGNTFEIEAFLTAGTGIRRPDLSDP
jgi:hypothetical protein